MREFALGFLFCMSFIAAYGLAFGEESKEKVLCDEGTKMEAVLLEKGYFHLLDMKNDNGVVEQLWTGGRSMVITAQKDNKICLLSTAEEVVYNPVTLQKIIEVFKKTQKEL